MNRVDPRPSLDVCIEWALKAGVSVRFFTQRSACQHFYCCTFETKIGSKIRTYEIKELTLAVCLNHIVKNYKHIFTELSCPPLILGRKVK
jgi:hypothetical protein